MKARANRTATLNESGNPAAPPGSREWSIAMRLEIQRLLSETTSSAEHLRMKVNHMRETGGYRHLFREGGIPFQTFEEFCRERPPFGLGYDSQFIDHIIEERASIQQRAKDAKPMGSNGRPAKEIENSSNGIVIKGGNNREYLLARLKRDAQTDPAVGSIFAKVERGEYKSVRAAAIDAGYVKMPSLLDQLKGLWNKATPVERAAFTKWKQARGR